MLKGFDLKLIQHQASKVIIPLCPTYYVPLNPKSTFSPTALKYYLGYQLVLTNHFESLKIITTQATKVLLPFIQQQINDKLVDHHCFWTVHPKFSCGHLSHAAANIIHCRPVTSVPSFVFFWIYYPMKLLTKVTNVYVIAMIKVWIMPVVLSLILDYLLIHFLLNNILALFVLSLHFLILQKPKKLLLTLLNMVINFM